MPVHTLAILGVGVVDPASPVLAADDPGLTRGDGCFEGCRVRDGAVDNLDAHLARMARSATALDLAFEARPWRGLVASALAEWTEPTARSTRCRSEPAARSTRCRSEPAARSTRCRSEPGEAAMKLLLTRGGLGLCSISPLPAEFLAQRRDGIAAVTLCRGSTSDAYADAPWLLGGVKTLSYAINMAAQREAGRRGAAEVIFYSTDGLVLEAPTATVVWRNGMTLCTTPIGDSGILAGTTAGLLFDNAAASGWRTEVTTARVADLRAAESLWLISATRGPVDVVVLDGAARPRDLERTATVRGWCGF